MNSLSIYYNYSIWINQANLYKTNMLSYFKLWYTFTQSSIMILKWG